MLLWVQLLICFSLTIEDASLFLAMYMWTAPASSQAIWVASPPVSATGECSTVNDCTLQVLQIDGLPKEWPNITGTVLSSFRLLTICGNDLHWYFRFQASQLLPLGLLFPLSSQPLLFSNERKTKEDNFSITKRQIVLTFAC